MRGFKMPRWFKRKEKRESSQVWQTQTSGGEFRAGSGSIPAVRKCLELYSSFLSEAKIDGSETIKSLLENPNPWESKTTFFRRLVSQYFLNGNFVCKIESDKNGIKALLPYNSNACYAYARRGDLSDPVEVFKGSYYYQDYKGRKFQPDDIFHLKDSLFSYDLVNGRSRVEAHLSAIESACSLIETKNLYAKNRLAQRSYLESNVGQDKDKDKAVANAIQTFFQSGKMILTLPPSVQLKQQSSLMPENPAKFFEVLNLASIDDIANAFNVPPELLTMTDATSGTGLKEILRFWVKTGLQSFFNVVAESLSSLSHEKVEFSLSLSQRVSEIRELVPLFKELNNQDQGLDKSILEKIFGLDFDQEKQQKEGG